MPGSRPPQAALSTDAGILPSGTAVRGVTLVFSRSAAQEADLQTLLAAQGNPSSPLYHQWLTPDAFAARFGMADADLAAVQTWLQTQGFSIDGVNRSRNAITFSGTAGSVGAAFATELHRYTLNGETHFAPSTDLSLPAALAPVVAAVLHTSDFRPKPSVRHAVGPQPAPDFTSSQSSPQQHYLTPKDVATMYNVQAVYSAGYTGVGQAIAVMGQSYVSTADIAAFQSAAGLPANPPTLVLMPGTGVSGVSSGDEGESDIDLEYAGGMAPGANVYLVYTGNSGNFGAFDALDYAITEDIAPVLSISYGACEPLVSTQDLNNANVYYPQAMAQGQTIFASAGDDGSEACYGSTGQSTAVQEQLAVSFPASSPYVTAVGGTQMASGASTAGSNTYWSAASGSDVVSSLLSYVPEVVWNEDSTTYGIAAGGGGTSGLYTRLSYQAGVAGIPSGTARVLPDISLLAATSNPGYLYCSSDLNDLQDEDLTSSCTTGFRDSSGKYVLVAGGTSFAAPIMAGLTALLNQAEHATGQGLMNTELYALAANANTYASAFHDITSGTIACTSTIPGCSAAGASGYTAGTGYDQATGLGSINFANLVAAWPATSNTGLTSTVTTLAAATAAPTAGVTDSIVINVASAVASAGTPTGSVAVSVDGGASTTVALTAGTSNSGTATYSYVAATTGGSHVITALYSGDTTHAASKGTTTVNITAGTLATGTFALSAANLTVDVNNAGTSAVTITPASGYNGNVVFTLSSPSNAPVVCYEVDPGTQAIGDGNYAVQVLGATPATLLLGVGATECGSATGDPQVHPALKLAHKVALAETPGEPGDSRRGKPEVALLAGLFGIAFLARRRSRRLPTLLAITALAVLGLGLSGCGGSGTGENTPVPVSTTNNYTLTLTGTDSVTSTITSSTTFTLTTNQ